MRHCTGRSKHRKQGSVLILAAWALFFLGALALAVGAQASAGLLVARRGKHRTAVAAIARAGVYRAVAEVYADTNRWDAWTESWSRGGDLLRKHAVGDGTFTVYTLENHGDGAVVTNYGLCDEESRFNICKASTPQLVTFLKTAGGLSGTEADAIAASIRDWQDADDDQLTRGAESSYYAGLAEPYPCHNGAMDTPFELLLVKGVDADLFARIEPFVTVYGTGKVNVNTAGPMVLRCVAGMVASGTAREAGSLVGKIDRFREAGNVFTTPSAGAMVRQLEEFTALTPGEKSLFQRMMGYLSLRSTCFRGTARGILKGNENDVRRIEFVCDRPRQLVLEWYEF